MNTLEADTVNEVADTALTDGQQPGWQPNLLAELVACARRIHAAGNGKAEGKCTCCATVLPDGKVEIRYVAWFTDSKMSELKIADTPKEATDELLSGLPQRLQRYADEAESELRKQAAKLGFEVTPKEAA